MITDNVDGFVLSDPKDLTGLSRILRELHSNSRLRRVVGERATRTAQAYTWDRHARDAWELLNEVASKKQTQPLRP